MSHRDNLIASLRAIMAARREELGEPPSPEELLAYRDGELGAGERVVVERRIAAFPGAARALVDLARFPDLEPAPGVAEVSEEDLSRGWERFRQQLEKAPQPEPPAEAPATWEPPAPGREARLPRALLRLAAAVLLMVLAGVGGYLLGRTSRQPVVSALNVAIAELTPLEERTERSAPGAGLVELPRAAEELVLVLGLLDPGDFTDYGVEILDTEGAVVWRAEGLQPTRWSTFHVALRRGVLTPGRYRIRLYGLDGEPAPLATYELQLLEE